VVEIENEQYRVTRITVAPRDSFTIKVGANEAALLVALTEGASVDGAQALTVGQERFLGAGRGSVVRPKTFAPVQLLQIDFLTRPAGAPK
jgi:hypothetical protein